MKITKREALNILDSIKIIENLSQLDILGYVFLRNTILLDPIENEYEKIFNFLKEEYKKLENVDEVKLNENKDYLTEVNENFITYINGEKRLNEFLNEDIEIDFVTFDLEELKNEKFKSTLIKPLIGKIII